MLELWCLVLTVLTQIISIQFLRYWSFPAMWPPQDNLRWSIQFYTIYAYITTITRLRNISIHISGQIITTSLFSLTGIYGFYMGNHPQMAARFMFVKYYGLYPDISITLGISWWDHHTPCWLNSAKIGGCKQKLLQIYGVINKRIRILGDAQPL